MLPAVAFTKEKATDINVSRRTRLFAALAGLLLAIPSLHAAEGVSKRPQNGKGEAPRLSMADATSDKLVAAVDFDLPAQPLGTALKQLAYQAGIQILFEDKVVDGFHAPAIKAHESATQVLRTLLNHTDLEYTAKDQTVVVRKKISAESPNAGVPDSENKPVLEQVVVTANKISERLLDVAETVTAVSGVQLEKLHSDGLQSLSGSVPNLVVQSGGTPGSTSIALRGISGQSVGVTVATLIDDTAVGSSAGWAAQDAVQLDLLPYDIERIEVLAGPQGTLYGASALGGVLKYVTRDPDVSSWSGHAGVEGFGVKNAQDAGYGVRGNVNAPLIPGALGGSLSAYVLDNPGYIDNPALNVRGENRWRRSGARVALKWLASADLSVKFQGMVADIFARNGSALRQGLASSSAPYTFAGYLDGDLTYPHTVDQLLRNNVLFTSATIDWNLHWARLLSVTAFSRTRSSNPSDASSSYGPYVPLVYDTTSTNARYDGESSARRVSEELRLTSQNPTALDWLAGLYFDGERSHYDQTLYGLDVRQQPLPGPVMYAGRTPARYEEQAAFGNITYHVIPQFDVAAGVRYSHIHQTISATTVNFLTTGNLAATTSSGSPSANKATWSVSPRWHIAADQLLFARVATGYRPGGANVLIPGETGIPVQARPDSTTDYELGYKGEFVDHRLQTTVSLYRVDWKDIQTTLPSADGRYSFIGNASGARSDGLEVTLEAKVTADLRVGVATGFDRARYLQDAPAVDVARGARLPLAPRWTGAGTFDYTFAHIGSWHAEVNGQIRYLSDQYSVPSSNPFAVRVPAYAVGDMSISAAGDRYRVSLYARNVSDKRAVTGAGYTLDLRTGATYSSSTIIQPRTVGVSIDADF